MRSIINHPFWEAHPYFWKHPFPLGVHFQCYIFPEEKALDLAFNMLY